MITAHHLVFGKYTQPIPTDYFLAYNFDGNLLDSSGNGRNATANGTITYGVGRKGVAGTAIQFGSGNIITPTLPTSSVWSFSFWIKNTNAQIGQIIELTSNPEATEGCFTFGNWGANNFRMLETVNQNHKSAPNSPSTSIYDTNWHHVVVIFNKNNSANDEITLYLDGVKQTLYIVNGQNADTTGNFISDVLYIGGRGASNLYKYSGLIDDFKLFNYPLTQTEITNLYNE